MKTDPLKVHAAKQYAERLKRIPSSQWCVGDYGDSQGRHCAVGHLVGSCIVEEYRNRQVERDFSAVLGQAAFSINDGLRRVGPSYVHTPKRNILRALNRIIKGKA